VELVPDDAAAARVVAAARAEPGRLMVQEWAPGELLHVAGVARAGAVLQSACYRAVGSPHSPFGPSAEVLTLDDPETAGQAAKLIGSLEYTGAFCLDFVRAADGQPLLIDVNARIFGSWAALQAAGLDLVGAWAYAWGLTDEPPAGAVHPGRRLRVLPPDLSLSGPRPVPVVLGAHLGAVGRAAGVLGPRWAVSAVARLLTAAAVRTGRRALRRVRR
jgi:hypothetical protein